MSYLIGGSQDMAGGLSVCAQVVAMAEGEAEVAAVEEEEFLGERGKIFGVSVESFGDEVGQELRRGAAVDEGRQASWAVQSNDEGLLGAGVALETVPSEPVHLFASIQEDDGSLAWMKPVEERLRNMRFLLGEQKGVNGPSFFG